MTPRNPLLDIILPLVATAVAAGLMLLALGAGGVI